MTLSGVVRRIENFLFNRVSLFGTVYFNFHYLPFKQAVRLPIYLHKPYFMREWGGAKFYSQRKGGNRL